MEDLQKLGAKSVPVVSRGEKFVFAQVIRDVVEFLELDEDSSPELNPEELAVRFQRILRISVSLVGLFPHNTLVNQLPNRPRSWKVLLHHVFQIPKAFLDHEENDLEFTYEMLTETPPEHLKTASDIADFGEDVRSRFDLWWEEAIDTDFSKQVPTYFGMTSRHELLESTIWHSTQHARQIESLLESINVKLKISFHQDQYRGLPLSDILNKTVKNE